MNQKKCSRARRSPSASSTSSLTNSGDLCLQEPKPIEEGEQSLQIHTFAAGLEAVDAGPSTLTRHLKRYAHLFIEDGQEGEPIATFHISKTTDLDLVSGPILIPHHPASQSLGRLEQTTTTCRETLS
jgi:hypothetical protein